MTDEDRLYELIQQREKDGWPVPVEIMTILSDFSKSHLEFDFVEWQFHQGVLVWVGNNVFSHTTTPRHQHEILSLEMRLKSLPEETHLYLWYVYKR